MPLQSAAPKEPTQASAIDSSGALARDFARKFVGRSAPLTPDASRRDLDAKLIEPASVAGEEGDLVPVPTQDAKSWLDVSDRLPADKLAETSRADTRPHTGDDLAPRLQDEWRSENWLAKLGDLCRQRPGLAAAIAACYTANIRTVSSFNRHPD